jgi:cardiolipin hydrolase
MHHKFAIIDNKLLLSGSFNWTRQAITGNHENVLITNNQDILSPYMEEFKRLWKLFDPADNL